MKQRRENKQYVNETPSAGVQLIEFIHIVNRKRKINNKDNNDSGIRVLSIIS
jgi:hypothetical protein